MLVLVLLLQPPVPVFNVKNERRKKKMAAGVAGKKKDQAKRAGKCMARVRQWADGTSKDDVRCGGF